MRRPDLQQLARLPLFASCPPRELELVDRTFTRHRVTSGTTLMRKGSVGRELFVLIEGEATVRIGERVVARLGPGEVVGEIAVLAPGRRTATVVAETDLDVLVGSRSDLADLLDGAPGVTRAILRRLAARAEAAMSS